MSKCPNLANPQVKQDFNAMINALGETISYGIYDMNGGNTIQYAPNGEPSKLYKDLLEQHNGDIEKAIRDKAKTYGSNFKEWFGDSKAVDVNGEPLVTDVVGNKDISEFSKESDNIYYQRGSGIGLGIDMELDTKLKTKLNGLYPAIKLDYEVPPVDLFADSIWENDIDDKIRYSLKVVDALSKIKDLRKTISLNTKDKPYIETNLRKLLNGKGVDDVQVNFVFSYIKAKGVTSMTTEAIIDGLVSDLSYVIEISVTKGVEGEAIYLPEENQYEPEGTDYTQDSEYYSGLTVPGGTNYKENEIKIPNIVPNIKGHAKFSSNEGIGWFRSDTKALITRTMTPEESDFPVGIGFDDSISEGVTKTRRILELQSDLFQKDRKNKNLITDARYVDDLGILKQQLEQGHIDKEYYDSELKELNGEYPESKNNFLQLLSKDGKWVNFFIQSIVQDSVKKGYDKVLFPAGETAARIEGHETIAEEIKEINKTIKKVKDAKIEGYSNKVQTLVIEGRVPLYSEGIINADNEIVGEKFRVEELNELEKQKQELKSQGIEKLKPIEGFYENRVGNTLNKIYGSKNVKRVTDEQGNQWNEVTVNTQRDLSPILLQKNELNDIVGRANIRALSVLIDPKSQKQDTLPHEYAHHYIAWFKNTPIVQEAIKKWGSEEALVQAIGEQVVKQEGEANTWWKKFTKWLQETIDSLSSKNKEELRDILTNTFLTGTDLTTGEKLTRERTEALADDATSGVHFQRSKTHEEYMLEAEAALKLAPEDYVLSMKHQSLIDDTSITALDKMRGVAIDNYVNRISSLKVAISKTDDEVKKDKYALRIDEMSEEVVKMRNDAKVGIVLDAVTNTMSGISTDLNTANTAIDLISIGEQLNSLDYILNNILSNELTPDIEAKVDVLKTDVSKAGHALTKLIQSSVLVHMTGLGYEAELSDITKIRDEGTLNTWSRSLNTAKSKLGRAISKTIVKVDKSIISTYNDKIIEPLNVHIDNMQEAGVNIFSKEVRESLLQKDSKGRPTKNFLDEYSSEYWDFIKKTKGDMFRLANLAKKDQSNGNFIRKEVLKLSKNLKKGTVMLDPKYFNKETSKEDKDAIFNELVNELGETKANELIKMGEEKLARYEAKRSNMELIYLENNTEDNIAAEKLEKWELYNDPSEFMKQANSNVSISNIDGMKYVAMMPKKKIDGKSSGFYDSNYSSMMNDNTKAGKALSGFFSFITETINEYKMYYPYHLRKDMDSNYLPEAFNELADGVNGNILGAGNLFHKLLDSLSESPTEERRGAIRDASGKLKGEIPAPLTDNKVDKLSKYVGILESQIRTKSLQLSKTEEQMATGGTTEEALAGIAYIRDEVSELKSKLDKAKEDYEKAYKHKSTDIVEVFKLFTKGALNYKRKSKVEDMVLLMQTVLNEAEQIETTFLGKDKPDGEYVSFKGGLPNLKKSVNYTIEAILYDKHREKEGNMGFKIGTDGKSIADLKEYKKKRKALYKDLKNGDITKEEFATKQLDLDNWIAKNRNVKVVTATKLLDTLHSFVYLKSLGWNPFSALANRLNGKLVNSVEGAANQFYGRTELSKAIKTMRNSVYKSATGKDNEVAHKNRILINKFGILFSMLETQYGSDKAFEYFKKKAGLLNPMEGQKRVEYINQGEVLMAMLYKEKVTNSITGEETNLYEAYDNNGKLKEGFDSESWSSDIDGETINDFVILRDKVLALNRKLHGNYDPSNPTLYKKYAVGRALGVFRSWLPEAYASRFAGIRMDDDLNVEVKGRYLSYAKLVRDEKLGGALKTTAEMLIKTILRKEYTNKAMDEIDLYNMRRNVKEIQWLLTTAIMYMLAKAAMPDDEDNKRGFILTLNTLTRLQGDMTQYFSPAELSKIANKPFPALSTLINVMKIVPNAMSTATNDDKNHEFGDWAYKTLKEVPLVNIPIKTFNITDKEY